MPVNETPLVSVCLVTYNHEKYIHESIRSVLQQSFSDLELVIVDDGSTDNTPQVIAAWNDPRIVSIRQENGGPSAATNRAVEACRGRYVAFMTGDDVCHEHRIQKQLQAYGSGRPRILFSAADFIDDDGKPFAAKHGFENVFDFSSHSQGEVLRRFFFHGNYINAVTGFTERALLCDRPLYDPLLFQLQDFDMWIRMAKRFPIEVIPERLLHFRIRSDNQNLSSPTQEHLVRSNNEYLFIMRRFFTDMSPELFREAFQSELRHPSCSSVHEIACEQAFLYSRASHPMQQLIALEKLYQLLSDSEGSKVLHDIYGFSNLDFVSLLKEVDLLRRYTPLSTLYIDTGSGFSESQLLHRSVPSCSKRFSVTYDLSNYHHVCRLRWDPIELRQCRLHLSQITWRTIDGHDYLFDLDAVTSNGSCLAPGHFSFVTPDPMILLPLSGEIASLTLEGSWEIGEVETLFLSFIQEQDRLLYQLHAAAIQLEEIDDRLLKAHRYIDLLQQQLQYSQNRGRELEEVLLNMNQSLSWRMTQPVRAAMAGVRRVMKLGSLGIDPPGPTSGAA